MKAKELVGKTVPELLASRQELEKKRLFLRFQSAVKGSSVKPGQGGLMRKDIARINTVLRQKQLGKG